jgi:CNT family concentrative nucleoside transporter
LFLFQDLDSIGQVLGLNYFVNTITAFNLMKELPLDPRSVTIATYALCGFTQPMTIGIQVAALGTLAPERKGEVTGLAFRELNACYQ